MQGFIESFLPIINKFKEYKTELLFGAIACATALISVVIYVKNNSLSPVNEEIVLSKEANIMVEVAGAVQNPGVYEATTTARLKDVLRLAGGLTNQADKEYFDRNFNLARIVSDQEKIYIPSTEEIIADKYLENKQTLGINIPNDDKININKASLAQLDSLPGVGPTTAAKIIQNRPYNSVEELLTRKIIKKNVYEQVKNSLKIDN